LGSKFEVVLSLSLAQFLNQIFEEEVGYGLLLLLTDEFICILTSVWFKKGGVGCVIVLI
jgi:hypothetical protein